MHISKDELAELLPLIVENNPIAISFSRKRKIIWANSGFYEIMGIEKKDGEAIDARALYADSDLYEKAGQKVYAQLSDQGLAKTETRIKRTDGQILDIRFTAVAIDKNDLDKGIIWYFEDITDRKRSRAALDKSRRLLEEQAVELKESMAELESFAYSASHDLQEPLRAISGYLSLIQEDLGERLEAREKQYLDRTINAASRLSDQIRSLLDYSRVTSSVNRDQCADMQEIANMAIEALSAAIERTSASIEIGELPKIQGDPVQIVRLVQNLVANALKFHRPDESPFIKVFSEAEPQSANPDRKFWRFGIRDNGIGIDPDQKDRVFQIFQRLDNSGKYEGTGVGLSICKKIVQNHKGRIWVESEIGKGATFYFTLPACEESEKKD
ncbi:MAG: sensor histidine kinase [Candidatus Sumerlaeia bacterium]